MNTIQEFLVSSKYILFELFTHTFEIATRNILDINCIPALKKRKLIFPTLLIQAHAIRYW